MFFLDSFFRFSSNFSSAGGSARTAADETVRALYTFKGMASYPSNSLNPLEDASLLSSIYAFERDTSLWYDYTDEFDKNIVSPLDKTSQRLFQFLPFTFWDTKSRALISSLVQKLRRLQFMRF